jgi:hypothetical protein
MNFCRNVSQIFHGGDQRGVQHIDTYHSHRVLSETHTGSAWRKSDGRNNRQLDDIYLF